MSKDFGLHTARFNLFYKNAKREENITRLKNFFKTNTGADRMDGLNTLLGTAEF